MEQRCQGDPVGGGSVAGSGRERRAVASARGGDGVTVWEGKREKGSIHMSTERARGAHQGY